ncbi:MAG: DUF2281 domain-containing protein [Dehalococcoidia bacterium]|nr:DUF2281 domain-containing protein [Dehalococcoidia bacterium]
MQIRDLILREIEEIPEEYLPRILEFVRCLEGEVLAERIGTAVASESSLKKDWLRPEEDEAWRDL